MGSLQHCTIHGHEVGYRLMGDDAGDPDRETVLLIHGMAGSSGTWRDVQPALARQFRVLAPDLLGHGKSAKPMGDYSLGAHASGLRDLMACLGIERATIVGQSLGGGVALQLAYQHPELCERLVLVSSGGLGREVSWLLRMLSLPGSELVLPIAVPAIVRDRGNAVSTWIRDRGIRSGRVAEMWRAYASLAEPENRQAFIKTLRAVVDMGGQTVSATDRLYLAEAVPTMIVWGDHDTIIPVDHAYAAHEAMPGSRLEIFPGIGHFPQTEAPERLIEVLVDFITTTQPAQARSEVLHHLLVEGATAT
ncbi:MAG: alpha/beta fold hydrolase [Acidimicrobiales bacterium]